VIPNRILMSWVYVNTNSSLLSGIIMHAFYDAPWGPCSRRPSLRLRSRSSSRRSAWRSGSWWPSWWPSSGRRVWRGEVVAGRALLPPREVHRRRVDRGGRSLTGASGRRAFAQILSQSRRVCDPVLQL
jgi:hypothetical protein